MISTLSRDTSGPPLEVLRDGHVIFTFGYAGPGPVLECVEALGNHLMGSSVRTTEVDLICAQLLVFAGVTHVEAERITPSAFHVLAEGGVEVRAGGVATPDSEDVGVPFTNGRDFFNSLRTSQNRMKLGWIA